MGTVKVFTDSTSDLSKDILDKYDIGVVPLYVTFGNETYKDGIDITTPELYEKVEECGTLPKTSAPSLVDFYNAFKPHIDQGDDILFIGISSKISSTINNAVIVSKEFPEGRIAIIDSLDLSTGIGLLVVQAAECAKKSMKLSEIVSIVEKSVPYVRTEFVIDTMEYLYKGGRCSALQSIVGSVLKIHPIIKTENGGMTVARKIRGNGKKILNNLLDNALVDKDRIASPQIFVTHSIADEEAEYLKEELQKQIPSKEIITTKAGCVISSHCGPGTVGILYILDPELVS